MRESSGPSLLLEWNGLSDIFPHQIFFLIVPWILRKKWIAASENSSWQWVFFFLVSVFFFLFLLVTLEASLTHQCPLLLSYSFQRAKSSLREARAQDWAFVAKKYCQSLLRARKEKVKRYVKFILQLTTSSPHQVKSLDKLAFCKIGHTFKWYLKFFSSRFHFI